MGNVWITTLLYANSNILSPQSPARSTFRCMAVAGHSVEISRDWTEQTGFAAVVGSLMTLLRWNLGVLLGHLFRSLLLEEQYFGIGFALFLPCTGGWKGCDSPSVWLSHHRDTGQPGNTPDHGTSSKYFGKNCKDFFFFFNVDPLVRKELGAECALTRPRDSVTHFSGFPCC